MIATFVIEIGLAAYTLWRYKLHPVSRLAVILLFCLALFQLAEFNVCEGTWLLDSAAWAKVGYVAITLLPPLGIHLINRMSKDRTKWLVVSSYVIGASFAAYFLFATGGISAGACLGNYVLFTQGHGTGYLYAAYYYGFLVAGMVYASYRAAKTAKHIRNALHSFVVGYALFMVPTTLVNVVDPTTIAGIPSIMCGFAVILAVVLVGRVLPTYYQRETLLERLSNTFKASK